MKIGFLSDSIVRQGDGISKCSLGLLKGLVALGHDVTLIDWREYDVVSVIHPKVLIVPNPFPFFKHVLWHGFVLNHPLVKAARFDLIFNSCGLFPLVGNLEVTCQLIYDLTDIRFPHFQKYSYLKKGYTLAGINRVLRTAGSVVTISETIKSELVQLFSVKEDRITVVPLAPTIGLDGGEQRTTVVDELLARYASYSLVVGTFQPRKNLKRILEAFTKAKQMGMEGHALVLVGKEGWKNHSLLKSIRHHPYRDYIVETGFVSPDVLRDLYYRALFSVYASLYEGFGFPLLDAMHTGCPLVASDLPVMREVGGSACYYVCPTSIEVIARGMLDMYLNRGLRERLRNIGLIRSQFFSWEQSGRTLSTVFEEMALRSER